MSLTVLQSHIKASLRQYWFLHLNTRPIPPLLLHLNDRLFARQNAFQLLQPSRTRPLTAVHAARFLSTSHNFQPRRGANASSRTDEEERSKKVAGDNESDPKISQQTRIKTTRGYPEVQSKNPLDWFPILDLYLPERLRITNETVGPPDVLEHTSRQKLLKTLASARDGKRTGQNLLTYALHHTECHDAVLYLVNFLLDGISASVPHSLTDRSPSNLAWPPTTIEQFTKSSLPINSTTYRSTGPVEEWTASKPDRRYSAVMSTDKDLTMLQIWSTIGEAIISTTDPGCRNAKEIMSAVYRMIAQIHKRGLIPENVYSYSVSSLSSMTQRPPILHLLSSRMLTALSDAEWRSHSNEAMLKAVEDGTQFRDLAKDPPGGRFRLKVRDLGPEIWLEFVLWCCAEGGFGTVGAKLVEKLKEQTGDPWFAINWTPKAGQNRLVPIVDWDRAKRRSGGTVGSIEGYSTDRPLVEMPNRTISEEVVQAMIETILNSTRIDENGAGLSLYTVQQSVLGLVTFLEPHSLPPEYFNYLTVRLAQTDSLDFVRQPEQAHSLVDMLVTLNRLEPWKPRQSPRVDLDYESIMHHSELYSGLLHQALQSYMDAGNIQQAIETFAEIQELVDSSKLKAIGSFWSTASDSESGFFSYPVPQTLLEYVESHGQLPLHRIAGFLNMITEAKLTRLGDWLFYSDDVDGPLIPPAVYGDACMITPIARFATESRDTSLVKRMLSIRQKSTRKPTINLLRALFNAHVSLFNFDQARDLLPLMHKAAGGGFGYSNIAQLGAIILRVERSSNDVDARVRSDCLDQARSLLEMLLDGECDGIIGDYTISTRRQFREQIGLLLQVFQNVGESSLSFIARKYQDRYRIGNLPTLSPPAFYILLSAIVDTAGAFEGKRLWELFCVRPMDGTPVHSLANNLADDEADEFEDFLSGPDDTDTVPTQLPHQDDQFGPIPQVQQPHHGISLPSLDVPLSPAYSDPPFTPTESPPAEQTDLQNSPIPFQTPSKSTRPPPTVIPDVKMLRIIVRAALHELRQRESGLSHPWTSDQQDILNWAAGLYGWMGVSKKVIEQEIQKSLPELAASQERIRGDDLRKKDKGVGVTSVKDFVGGAGGIQRLFEGRENAA